MGSLGIFASKSSIPVVCTVSWLIGNKLALAFSSLSNTYREIAIRSNQLERWPDSQKLCDDYLVYDGPTQSYRLPTFSDGHGSLGVFTFLGRNENASFMMEACDGVFSSFCQQITTDVLKGDKIRQDTVSDWIFRSPFESDHISVAILQEHPSFLRDPEDLAKWQPISSSTIQQLGVLFANDHANVPAPQLELDSLLWTPDGALIAGFVEDGEEFESLRKSTRHIARETL